MKSLLRFKEEVMAMYVTYEMLMQLCMYSIGLIGLVFTAIRLAIGLFDLINKRK